MTSRIWCVGSRKLTSFILLTTALATTNWLVPKPATAQIQDGAKKRCLDNLLYTTVYLDGAATAIRTDVSQIAAAITCRKVTTWQQVSAIRRCVNGLLYTYVSSDGTGYGSRTDVSGNAATVACEKVTTEQRVLAVRSCVNQLLYLYVNADGSGAGSRTDLSPEAAAEACRKEGAEPRKRKTHSDSEENERTDSHSE